MVGGPCYRGGGLVLTLGASFGLASCETALFYTQGYDSNNVYVAPRVHRRASEHTKTQQHHSFDSKHSTAHHTTARKKRHPTRLSQAMQLFFLSFRTSNKTSIVYRLSSLVSHV